MCSVTFFLHSISGCSAKIFSKGKDYDILYFNPRCPAGSRGPHASMGNSPATAPAKARTLVTVFMWCRKGSAKAVYASTVFICFHCHDGMSAEGLKANFGAGTLAS